MKFCETCKKNYLDEADFCTYCGSKLVYKEEVKNDDSNEKVIEYKIDDLTVVNKVSEKKAYKNDIAKVAKILMVIGCILTSIYGLGIPLFWCLPMVRKFNKKVDNGELITTGFKVCLLMFVSVIGGILAFCMGDPE